MVGVAGKSLACGTCKKRRVKCDFGRPSCLKCISSKRECTGYGRDLIFINRTASDPTPTASSVISERTSTALQQQKQAKLEMPIFFSKEEADSHYLDETHSDPTPSTRSESTSSGQPETHHQYPHPYQEHSPMRILPPTFLLREEADLHYFFAASSDDANILSFRTYAVELLKATYLPKCTPTDIEPREGSFSWVYRLKMLSEPSRALDTALFAFCLAQLHITGTGNTTLYQCYEQYNIALQHLISDLADSNRQANEETLAAILALSTFELFLCPSEDGWSVHARGILEILCIRNPVLEKIPACLLGRLRIVCTLEALTKRQSEPMENGIWRQVSAEPALALGDVFRMVSKIPVILEQACALPSISDLDLFSDTASHVVQEMFSSVRTLDMWINEFISTFPNNRYWPVQSIARNVADNGQHRVFPTCFEFQTISIAAPIVQTWAALAQLYSNIIQIHDLVQARLGQPISLEELQTTPGAMIELEGENLSIAEIQAEGTRMLRNVCQSMEYFHRMEMGTYGNHAITYPAWSARQYARLHPGHERELTWLQNMHKMEGSGTRWGMSKMTFADIAEPIGGWSRHGQYGKNINGVEIGMRTGETGSSWDRSSMEMGFSSIGSSEQ